MTSIDRISVSEKIKKWLLNDVLSLYSEGELSAGRTSEMLILSRAEFYEILNQRDISLPEKTKAY